MTVPEFILELMKSANPCVVHNANLSRCAAATSPSHRDFTDKLAKHSHSLGMWMERPCDIVFQQEGKLPKFLLEELVLKHQHLQLVMVILPKKGAGSGYGMYVNPALLICTVG